MSLNLPKDLYGMTPHCHPFFEYDLVYEIIHPPSFENCLVCVLAESCILVILSSSELVGD